MQCKWFNMFNYIADVLIFLPDMIRRFRAGLMRIALSICPTTAAVSVSLKVVISQGIKFLFG